MHRRPEHTEGSFQTLENNLRKTIIEGNKTIIVALSKNTDVLDKNFGLMRKDMGDLIQLMKGLVGGGRLPSQPVHFVDDNTQAQPSYEHVNAVTELRSEKMIPKRGDELKNSRPNFQNQHVLDRSKLPSGIDPIFSEKDFQNQCETNLSKNPSGIDPITTGTFLKNLNQSDRSNYPVGIDPTSFEKIFKNQCKLDRSNPPTGIDPKRSDFQKSDFSQINSNTSPPFPVTPHVVSHPKNKDKGVNTALKNDKNMGLNEDDLSAYAPRLPFPQRLAKPKILFNKEVFDTLQQVKVNIPYLMLLDKFCVTLNF